MLLQFNSDAALSAPVRLFYSYSHKDKALRSSLDEHLAVLKRQGFLETWYDRQISPGDNWKNRIDENLERAKIILLLISPSFVASDYCFDVEMKRAIQRHAEKDAVVIPVILRPVFWKILPFSELQALPQDGKPIITWKHRDEAFANVAEGLRKVIFELGKHGEHNLRLSEEDRWHWIIELEGTVRLQELAHDLLRRIQTLSADDSVKAVAISDDKHLFVFEGSEEGFRKIEALFREGALPSALGVGVTSVHLTYGATTRATSEPAAAESLPGSPLDGSSDIAFPSEKFSPSRLMGIFVPTDNLLQPQTFLDTGNEDPGTQEFEQMPTVLLGYFNAALAVDSDDLWCNLSAYESNRMVPAVLGDTLLGHDLLEQDVLLKRFTASLLHPDTEAGGRYWREVLTRSERLGAQSGGIVTTFQKIWIKPTEAQVYTTDLPEVFDEPDAPIVLKTLSHKHGKCAFITRAELGVFCDEDLFALQADIRTYAVAEAEERRRQDVNHVAVEVFKEMILPLISEEVNERHHFRKLRQIYASCILAKWFKETFVGVDGYDGVVNTGVVQGVRISDIQPIGDERGVSDEAWSAMRLYSAHAGIVNDPYQDFDVPINRQFFSAYMTLFRRGLFDVVRPVASDEGQVFRRYFSGGIELGSVEVCQSASCRPWQYG